MLNCIGIDVSKSTINVHISKTNQDLLLDNNLKSFRSLFSKLKKIYKKEIEDIIFIFEPTGSYSEALRKYCSDKNIKCFIINPKQFSNYAKALGVEVKNDVEDARVLSKALHLAKEEQVKVPVFNEDVEQMKELMSFYRFTKKQTTQQQNHLESLNSKDGDKFSIRELQKSIDDSKKKELRIIEQIQMLIDSTDEYRIAYENIISIKGVGQIAAIVLLHLFLKYPEANQRQITSLTGLNPIYRQSGTSIQSGYRIAKTGAGIYRGTLFMATLSAIQHDKNFKALYDRLKSKGKHSTSAQIAVMRKIILTALSLYKNNRKYDENFNTQKVSSME